MILFYIILLAGVVSNSKEAEVVKPALPATCALRSCGTANQGSSGGNVGAPKIVKNQRVIETSIGNLLIFSCKLCNDSPAAKIKWKFKSIQSKKYVNIKPPAVEDHFVINKFIIVSVSKKDVGSYKCIATNEAGQDEHIFKVKIKAPATEPPQIDKTFRMFRATAKYPFALNCKIVGGHPATKITWQYRKRQNAQYKKLKQKGEVLMFKSAQISDTGYYRCVAVNEAGTDSHVMRLYVKETLKRSRIEGTGDELIQKSKLRPPMKRNKQRKPRKGWSSTDSESDSDSSSDSNKRHRGKMPNKKRNRRPSKRDSSSSSSDSDEGHRGKMPNKKRNRRPPKRDSSSSSSDSGERHRGKMPNKKRNRRPPKRDSSSSSSDSDDISRMKMPIKPPQRNSNKKWGVIIPTNQSGSSSERESDSSGTTSDSDGFRVEIPTNQTEESPSERDSDSSAATSDSDEFLKDEKKQSQSGLRFNVSSGEFFRIKKQKRGGEILHDENDPSCPTTRPPNPIKPPVIDKTITRVKSAVGFPTAFDCKVIAGDPRVTIQWMFQKEQANDRIKDLHHNRTPYMITSVQPEDAGFYICHAENGGGTDSHRIKLFVTDFMNKPVPGRGNATDAFESPIQRGDPPNCLLAKNPPNSNKPARKND
ncbi:uncharacterized protein isoform X2 [Choristoneura fumiferana]|uniref:uncharacterized protein isoform X2 n=1 Tax=Choristoneura fumiferana TaxID=7141 RepID=UPI003D15C274